MTPENYTLRGLSNFIHCYTTCEQIKAITGCSISAALKFLSANDEVLKGKTLTALRKTYYKGQSLMENINVLDVERIKPLTDQQLEHLATFSKQDIKKAAS